MGFPWKKVLGGVKAGAKLGSFVGVPFAGTVVEAINIVEDVPGLKGPQKKEAAKALALRMVQQVEGDSGANLVNDAKVVEAVDQFIDSYVALMNTLAAVKHIKENES